MKLWDKGIETEKQMEAFTVGKDRELDLYLAPWDIAGSIAHVKMLGSTGLMTDLEVQQLIPELISLYNEAIEGTFIIDENSEDVHSQVEKVLTLKVGEAGEKIHTGRSRNDQVLLDLRLFARKQLHLISEESNSLFKLLISLSNENKEVLMPGYTHMQAAMPSSFGLWFGAFAESLTDDMTLLASAYKIVNQNPLGSAAGYGSSFPLDRKLTTKLLGFDDLNYNSVYAQMTRGKMEKSIAFSLSSLASTLSKLSMDMTLFVSQNFAFASLPDKLTTGTSIMPHKKNPDAFELIRAKCNKIQALPNEIAFISNNLSTGYHRDFQVLKESIIPTFSEMLSCLKITQLMLSGIKVKRDILKDEKYLCIFSVEKINKLVTKGVSFRDAYKEVAKS
ncbi:MAG: argininosuccinate lyase, partial [Bacteroidales bacterium]|nr:argininosuccinate lyase [Bacteroidales bacterium]